MTPRENFCSCCREQREKEGKGPLPFKRLPPDFTHTGFGKPGLPIRMCEHCDGDAFKQATKLYEERTKK